MGDVKHMHMVSDVVHGPDGHSVEYGPGELHDPGSLPDGVPYRDVLVTEAEAATAPAHAKQAEAPAPEPAPAESKAAPSGKSSGKSG